jgi:hypothetical protein
VSQIHVRIIDRRWAVVRPETSTSISSHDERDAAIRAALAVADAEKAELVVFTLDGRPIGKSGDARFAST